MPQGPILISDKSTIQSLTLDEAALLDSFYMSNIPPVFFAECLADLERDMGKMKGTPESLVGALATLTPDEQACGNVFHMRILESESMGQFDLNEVHYRPLRDPGQPVTTGDSKGLVFVASEEEKAVQRWAERDFLNLERQIAKQWRRMIEKTDLNSMSANMRREIGPWRRPNSLQDAKFLTDTIIDSLDPEWLLGFGLLTLGMAGWTVSTVNRWKADRRKPLRKYFPYFVHVLSINLFFALVLPTQLLRNVKPTHKIDLAYLYYLPFCTVFTSRDNFHVQVAPLFMDDFQTFVHGDDLKADLGRLDERYKGLPQDELDKGLIGFAPHPPGDISFLTTRLWDKYLPKWREPHTPLAELPKEVIEGIHQLVKKVTENASPEAHNEHDVSKLDFVTISKKVSTKKGSYLRFSKETILKIAEDEKRKARGGDDQVKSEIHPAGTGFEALSKEIARLSADPECRNLEVYLLEGKLDQQGNKILRDGMWTAEIRSFGVDSCNEVQAKALLKEQDEAWPIVSILLLWTRYGIGKVGILRFKPISDEDANTSNELEDWQKKLIGPYLDRHNL